MWQAAVQALAAFSEPRQLLLLVAGVLAGVVVGILPGLGGTAAVALLLPFVYRLEPAEALALLVGALAVVHTSDTISAVLLGAPGSASAAVTMMDGHALARQGQAARALSAAFLASMTGGILGALGLTLSIPVARPLVLAFGSPELFMLCALGISLTAALSEGFLLRGMLSALVGLLLGMVGVAPTAPDERFTFGQVFLMDGLPLVAVALGVFGLAEIAELVGQGGAIATRVGVGSGWLQGVRDFLRHWWLVVQGALIGMWAGILPGIGATAGTWMAYGQVVATSRDRSRFGKGDIRGVIAPESANNAVEAGDLVPTLLFSIPGSVPAALLMGALLLHGVQPGPRIVTQHLDLIYTIVWSFALANVLGAAICFLLTPALARLTFVPFSLLAPAVFMAMVLGAYQEGRQMGDLVVMVALGIVGWIFKRAGYPRAPLLIGFVLSLPAERYYWLSMNLYGWAWLTRPWVLVMLGLLVLSVIWGVRASRRQAESAGLRQEAAVPSAEAPDGARSVSRWSLGVAAALFALFALSLGAAFTFTPQGRLLPALVCGLGVALGVWALVADALALRGAGGRGRAAAPDAALRQAAVAFGWMALFVAASGLLGLYAAVVLSVPLFLHTLARLPWKGTLAYTAAVLVSLQVLGQVFGLIWPVGLVRV
ncbi:MAG TPA: tripartite tricarboxylate transporter permease [Limnochordales bacterium]